MATVTPIHPPCDSTYVYYCFCAHGGLLYVGVAKDLQRRLGQHKAKPWWPDVDFITAHVYWTRAQALQVEQHVIWHDHPMHNVAGHNPYEVPCRIDGLPAELNGSLTEIWVREADGRLHTTAAEGWVV